MSAPGMVIALGSVTLLNEIAVGSGDVDWVRIPVATAILTGVATMTSTTPTGESVTKWVAGIALLTACVTPIGNRPAPVESLVAVIGRLTGKSKESPTTVPGTGVPYFPHSDSSNGY